MTPTAIPSHFTFLWCIAINDQLEVLLEPFQLCTPLDDDCDILRVLLRIAFPFLRKHSDTALTLLKSISTFITSDQSRGTRLGETHVNRRALVVQGTVRDRLATVVKDTPGPINLIIRLHDAALGAYCFILTYQLMLTLSHSDRIQGATFPARTVGPHLSHHDKIGSGG